MHSDQTRKDGSSESMIQALYYDFVANYVKTRMYSIRYDAAGALRMPISLTPDICRTIIIRCNVRFSIVCLLINVSCSCLLPSILIINVL